MIVATLNTKTTIVNSGQMSFDFCSGNAPNCIFKEYCQCLEYWSNPIDVDVLSIPDDDYKDSEQANNKDSPPDEFESDIPF